MRAGRTLRLAEIAEQIGALSVAGGPAAQTLEVEGLASLRSATSGQLSFVTEVKYLQAATASAAGALITTPELAEHFDRPCILHPKPYLGYALATALFAGTDSWEGIHPSAVIDPSANLGSGLSIGPQVVIGRDVRIGDRCTIGAGTVIGANCELGEGTRLDARVTLYSKVSLGRNCLVHAGAVIGADGFGFAPDGERWVKIHQLGGVRIGSEVEIGANTCIDRGALDDTVIEDGVKIDDLVMIAHNVRIGAHSALAGQVGIAGSAEIGRHCVLAGNSGLVGHIRLTDNVQVTGKTMITSSITEPGSYSSGTPYSDTRQWRKNAARFNQLDRLVHKWLRQEKNN